MSIVIAVAFIFTLILSVWAAISDFKTLQIPNVICLAIAASFCISWIIDRNIVGLWWTPFAIACGVFLMSYIMFVIGSMGAGDSKLATALSLWLGVKPLGFFIFYMALFGAVLALAALLIKKRKLFSEAKWSGWISQLHAGRNAIPYGIAIVFGFFMAVFKGGLLQRYIFLPGL